MLVADKNKKKITQITRFAYPHDGGVEAVIYQISHSLSDSEFDKEVYCCSNTNKTSVDEGVKHVRCKYLFDFAANSVSPEMFFRMMFLKTDILHLHMPVMQSVIIWAILHLFGFPRYKKLTITYHSDVVGYDKYMKYFGGIYRYFLSKVDKIHVLSPDLIESSDLLREFKDKCTVIPYGIELSKDNSNDDKVAEIKNKYAGKKILFSCGRLVKYKGFKYAIEAMKNIDNAVYLLGGNGTLKEEFVNYIKENNLSEKVILLGRVSDEDLDSYYKACDIYLFPSVMKSEAFGIVQLEAMFYGKPVINTYLGTGVNFVSLNNETGLTVEPCNSEQLSNAVKTLCDNDDLRNEYGNNAKNRVETVFNLENLKKCYSDFFKDLL